MLLDNLLNTSLGYKCDRSTALGNPFKFKVDNDGDRELVIKAFKYYITLIVLYNYPVPEAIAETSKHYGLKINSNIIVKSSRFTRTQVITYLQFLIDKYIEHPATFRLLCWCLPKKCHIEVIDDLMNYLIKKGIYPLI